MNTIIYPSTLSGTINAVPSKSMTQRAIIIGSLFNKKTTIYNPLICDDTITTINILKNLGISFINKKNKLIIKRPKTFLDFSSASFKANDCGTSIRMLAPIILSLNDNKDFSIYANKRLIERLKDEDFNPIGIKIKKIDDKVLFSSGDILHILDITHTSQTTSGYIISKLLKSNDVSIKIKDEIDPYVLLTLDVLALFGFFYNINKIDDINIINIKRKKNKTSLTIDGDYSLMSNFLVVNPKEMITINNLHYNSIQNDKKIIDILLNAGYKLNLNVDNLSNINHDHQQFNVSLDGIPDLALPIILGSMTRNTTSKIYDLDRLIDKESNRLQESLNILDKLNISYKFDYNCLEITGQELINNPEIEFSSCNDHRIVFMLTLLSNNLANPIKILNSEVIKKSYPTFFDDFKTLGGRFVHEDN